MAPYLEIACRSAIALVFLAAAAGKLRAGVDAFAASILDVVRVPARHARLLAGLVITGELIVAGLLVVPRSALVGLATAALLTVALVAVVITALQRGSGARCACFGVRSTPFGKRHVLRNLLMIGVVATGAWFHLPASAYRPQHYLLGVLVGLVVAALLVAFDDIAELFVGPPRTAGSRERV
ncbi:hypothetical protein GA0074695_4961 [Micromonospora viridifaciens]|uniref:Methylamine utilisation protein MauE domain-containing protein n=1 Tax=Micromonospora viridifaciens TaxID=1881 RepID=A0A1C4Z0P3_MICVI|nr:MauE/DoxX family redox-associated membrane protein [Micromonospora viridifaciens]SCF26612.1 hypothetical protein GA0074695_4961 [Micromonospora viridifaciens]